MNIATIILGLSLLLLAWAWLGYPLLLAIWAGRRPAAIRQGQDRASDAAPWRQKTLSVIIAAYNEEEVIRARLDNLAQIDLPPDTELLIGGDGCDDRTIAIIDAWGAEHGTRDDRPEAIETSFAVRAGESSFRLRRFDFQQRRGKPSVLKDLVAASTGDILLFSDANTLFAVDAAGRLLAPLAHPEIGGTCGRLAFVDGGASTKENVYWQLETWLKIQESRVDSCLGANGAIYAIRRELFWIDLPATAIIDDFVVGMKVREQGCRMLYVPDAIAYEDLPTDVQTEWRRRIRIGAGDFQAIGLCRRCLRPSHGFFALAFWSHKILRWCTPHLMLLVLATSIAALPVAESAVLKIGLWLLLAAQAAWYAMALAGVLLTRWNGSPRTNCPRQTCSGGASLPPVRRLLHFPCVVPRAIYYFCAMQLALLLGFIKFLRGIRSGTWQRTAR